jgi:UDP-glucose 4-epimerase
VWGARGFIGRATVAHLRARGSHVRVLTRAVDRTAPVWPADVERVELPAAERATAFDRALADVAVVFNLAGSSGAVASNRDPIESLDSNCRLQLEFLAACQRAPQRVHIVFASSRLVYEPAGVRPVAETSRVQPRSVYAAHKLCVEHYHQIAAQTGRVSYTICRISNPYGLDAEAPGKSHGFINALIQRAYAGQSLTVFGDGRQLRDYIHIDDLTALLCRCGERSEARNSVLNLGCGESISIRRAAKIIQRVLGGGRIEFCPWPDDYHAVESGDFVMDTSLARHELAYSPQHTFETGIAAVRARGSERSVSVSAAPPPTAAAVAITT